MQPQIAEAPTRVSQVVIAGVHVKPVEAVSYLGAARRAAAGDCGGRGAVPQAERARAVLLRHQRVPQALPAGPGALTFLLLAHLPDTACLLRRCQQGLRRAPLLACLQAGCEVARVACRGW